MLLRLNKRIHKWYDDLTDTHPTARFLIFIIPMVVILTTSAPGVSLLITVLLLASRLHYLHK